MEKKTAQEWRPYIIPAINSKLSEFKLIGYGDVNEDVLWRCLEEKVWKGNPKKRLHEIIQDIFHLQPSTYMNFLTVETLQDQDDDLLASIQAVMRLNK